MAPPNNRGNGPAKGGKGKTTGFPQMPKPKQSSEAQAQNGLATEEHQTAQEEEIAALEAIYANCFERKEAKVSAWQVGLLSEASASEDQELI